MENSICSDDVHIKRPKNSFMIWSCEFRKILLKHNSGKTNSQISVELGKIWSNMPESEKLIYKIKADAVKLEHKLKYPNYVYRPIPKSFKKNKILQNSKIIKKKIIKNKLSKFIQNFENIYENEEVIKHEYLDYYQYEEPDYFNQLQMFYSNL